MAITLALRTDPGRVVSVSGLRVTCCLCPFPQPGPSTLVFTQLLDAVVRQEVTYPLPADLRFHGWLQMPPPFGTAVSGHYHTLCLSFGLLSPGVGVDSFRLRLMDGVTVVFDESFVF